MTIGIRLYCNDREVLIDLSYEQREAISRLPIHSTVYNDKKAYEIRAMFFNINTNILTVSLVTMLKG